MPLKVKYYSYEYEAGGVKKLLEQYHIFCPGCKTPHAIGKGIHGFNNDFDKPTFTPSLLATGTETPTDDEVKRILAGEKIEPRPIRCHSYITNGKMQFLNDCTHELKNQTVDLPEFEEEKK